MPELIYGAAGLGLCYAAYRLALFWIAWVKVHRLRVEPAELDCGCPRTAAAIYFCMHCDAARCRNHKDPHRCTPDAFDEAVLLTHEKLADDDESDGDAEHFTEWETELRERPAIAKHLRRMERWSQ